MTFAVLLKQRRESAGLTQAELAERSGVSAAAIRDLEQARSRRPRPASVRALAAALGMSSAQAEEFQRAALAAVPTPEPIRRPDPGAVVRIAVLGPLEVFRGDVPVRLGAGRHRAVLVRLALTAGVAVPREELIELLWAGACPPSAVNLVQTYISRLRRVLDPGLLALGPNGYQLNVEEERLDLLRFRALTARANAAPAHEAAGLLEEALALWRGEIGADTAELKGDPLLTALAEEHIGVAVRHAALSPSERVLPRLRRLARRHRWHEPLHAQLIATLAATGRQAEALAVFAAIRDELADELGIDPGPELARAHLGVLQQRFSAADDLGEPPAPRQVPAPFQAPAPPADFTGRKDQLRRIEQLLWRDAESSAPQTLAICAISGVAGVGKTTLALQAAQRARPCFPDGQLYVDLNGAGPHPVAPLQALARLLHSLGVDGRKVPTDEGDCAALLRSELDQRRVLLILDNVRDSAQVRPLLPGTGGCAVIVTSRRRLADLAGAALLDLAALPLDDAVELLASMIGQARVAADPPAARELAQLCGLLPVALRVASGRLAARPDWSIGTLLERLRDKRGRLGELNVGNVDVTAGFQLSYQDLAPPAARAFRLLSLIPGDDFTADAAAAALGGPRREVEQQLGDLIEGNLLRISPSGRAGYHDLLRLYAIGRAEAQEPAHERAAAIGRLLDWWLARVTAAMDLAYPAMVRLPRELPAEDAFGGPQEALSWLDSELSALVAGVEHAAAHGPRPRAWQLADQLRGYFFLRRNAVMWLATAEAGMGAALAEGDPRAQAAMHQSMGQAQWSQGAHEPALSEYLQGEALAEQSGWSQCAAYLRHNIGLVQAELGRMAEAQESYRRALEASRRLDLWHVQAVTLNDLGAMCHEQGRLTEAAEHFREALKINESLSRKSALSNHNNLGMVLRQLGQFDDAYGHLQIALSEYRETSEPYGELGALDELSQLHTHRGEHAAARSAAGQGLDLARIISDRRAEAALLATLGEALLAGGDVAEAQRHFEQCHDLADRRSYPYYKTKALIGLALTGSASGHPADGLQCAQAALDAARAAGYRLLEADALVAAARNELARGQAGEAARLCGTALGLYTAAGSPLKLAEVQRMLELVSV